ncbi:MAG: hypothetical protein ACI4WR_02315 [Bulleidia sp.]
MKLDEYPNLKDRIGELDEGAASWQSSGMLRNVTAAAIVIVVVLFLRERLIPAIAVTAVLLLMWIPYFLEYRRAEESWDRISASDRAQLEQDAENGDAFGNALLLNHYVLVQEQAGLFLIRMKNLSSVSIRIAKPSETHGISGQNGGDTFLISFRDREGHEYRVLYPSGYGTSESDVLAMLKSRMEPENCDITYQKG